jgi:hypothetical protein
LAKDQEKGGAIFEEQESKEGETAMIEKVKTYFERLENLSTEELDHSTERLVRAEKRNVALVIAHIAEMSRRKGHLERGYKSLFDYCVRRLRLSEGSVARRIQVANVARRFPQILVALAENRMSLTVAGLLAPVLEESNVDKLLDDCAELTKREAEEHLVALRPRPVFPPSIRRTPSRHASTSPHQAPPVQESRPTPRVSASILEPARPEVFNFRFAADREFKEKFQRLAEVLGVQNPLQHMADIMEQALDIALDKKDLKRKRARRLERKPRTAEEPRPGKVFAKSRYIPSEVRERVHERAGYECEYRGPDGTRCRARTGLQIEHLRPFAIFRSHDERWLRLHCAPHNRLTAERTFGVAFIKEKSPNGPSYGNNNTWPGSSTSILSRTISVKCQPYLAKY